MFKKSPGACVYKLSSCLATALRFTRYGLGIALCFGPLIASCSGVGPTKSAPSGEGQFDDAGLSESDAGLDGDALGDGIEGSEAGGSSDAAPGCSSDTCCGSTNMCGSAKDIGSVNGDTGMQTATASGATSQWLSVHVTEAVAHRLLPHPMRMTVVLVSPANTNFDVYVYVDTHKNSSACGQQPSISSTKPEGQDDQVSLVWGDRVLTNLQDNSRTVLIEVRHVSGNCSPSAPWTLNVQGDTAPQNTPYL